MRAELLEILRCPKSAQRLSLRQAEYDGQRIRTAQLVSADGQHSWPVRDFIPRFVPASNYADNFGMQWNKFRSTQLDSYSGHPISANRFWHATGWRPQDLAGRWVLDVGCGAGRFAEVALGAGAKVVALDYSSAVDACYLNLQGHENLHVVQGDIYALPFARHFFAFAYCLGVLQHTPDVARAFAALPPVTAGGGHLCVDFYQKSWKSALLPKYWLRPFTRRMPKDRLFALCETLVPKLLPLSRALACIPVVGGTLRRMVPVANHFGILPLDTRQQQEWSLLDTFDWLSPEFDNPQTPGTVQHWFDQAGMRNVEVLKAGHLTGRGVAPDARGD